MPTDAKGFAQPLSFLSLLAGWAQQGAQTALASQRALADVTVRQAASAVKSLQSGLSEAGALPANILTDVVAEATANFIDAQRILLDLAQQENELIMNGVKERVDGSAPAAALTDIARRTLSTFLEMQQDFLTLASQQAQNWYVAAQAGKYNGVCMIDVARQALGMLAQTQQKLMSVIADEVSKATGGKQEARKMTKTEIHKIAKDAADAFIEAQKKLLDIAGRQANTTMDAASRGADLMKPLQFIPAAEITRQGVRSFVQAQKAILDTMIQRPASAPEETPKKAAPKAEARKASARNTTTRKASARKAAEPKPAPRKRVTRRKEAPPMAQPAHAGL